MSKHRRTAQAQDADSAAAGERGANSRRTKGASKGAGPGGANPRTRGGSRGGSRGADSKSASSGAGTVTDRIVAEPDDGVERILGLYRQIAAAMAEAGDLTKAVAGTVECFCHHVPFAAAYGIVEPGARPRREVWWAGEEERYDPLRDLLGGQRYSGPVPSGEAEDAAAQADGTIIGRVLASGLPVVVERLAEEPLEEAQAAVEAGLGAAHAFPVFFGSEVVAAVVFFSLEPGALGQSLTDAVHFALRQLEVVAGSEKAERAVRAAARHARAQAAELNEMAVRLQVSGAHGGDGMYDALSGFPRRRLLLDRLQQTLRRRQRNPDLQFAVACLGIEGLRQVRDRLGLRASEECLLALCRRMEAAVRPADTVARTGEDEFTVILEDCDGLSEASAAAERIQAAVKRPFLLDGEETALTASIGLTLGPSYEYAETILRDAMAALRASRAFGDEQPRVFDLAEQPRSPGGRLAEDDLARALRDGELALEYQPVVSLRSGRVAGFEARARWLHPERGPLAPEQFLPESGAGPAVSALLGWSIREACAQILEWRRHRPGSAPYAALTLSPEQFYSPDLVAETWDVLTRTDLDGRLLRFVVGEGVLARSPTQAAQVLASLGALEVGVVMDGFGIGYSSLPNLHRLRPRGLIIDRAFLVGASRRPSQWLVARTIVELARIIDAEPIAAGIETESQLARLFELGCLRAQGPYFGGGLRGDRTRALLEEGFGPEVRALQRPDSGECGHSPFARFLEGRS